MGVKVEVGKEYPVKGLKSGSGAKGLWAFVPVVAEKGFDKITLWAENPQDILKAQYVRVKSIKDVSITKTRKEGPDGEHWFVNYNVTATLESIEGRKEGDEWVTAEDDLDDIFKL